MQERDYAHPYVLSGLNAFRTELGLAPIASVCELESRANLQLCLFPEWYCREAGDSPLRRCVGFPLPRPHRELPRELSTFIDQRGRPIVFTPGTGVMDVSAFFAAARQCCEQLGRPGLFLSPGLPAQHRGPNGLIYQLDYLDLEVVLPRAALLVHHGGMGTTARALEAGIPQIVSPQAFDQPDNGDRISRLGVGAMIHRRKLTGEALAGAAGALLDSPDVQQALFDLSQRVRASNGLTGAADALESHFLARAGRLPDPSRPERARLGANP
ncbi:MAG: nucleotide disphospho-sugar-binding domain-containing protein [Deltaproteobacteria bacterium]